MGLRDPKLIDLSVRPKKKPKLKTRVKRRAKRAASRECPRCHKRYTNPLTHTCTVKTDFAKQKAAAARRAKTAEKRDRARARKKAASDRRKAAAAGRRAAARNRAAPKQRAPQHDYRMCRDEDCRRTACIAFQEGIEACPLDHAGA